LLVAWSGMLLATAPVLGTWHPLVAGLAGMLFALVLSSLGEWIVHAWLYHRTIPGLAVIRRIHHHGHHFALFPPHRYSKVTGFEFMNVRPPLTPFRMAATTFENLFTKFGQVALHLVVGVPLILLPAWLFAHSGAFVVGSLLALTVVSWMLAHVHGAIHTPKGRWIERHRWFQWLDHHHYIHHVDLSSNINFMLPLCDVLFGTRKAHLTAEERVSHPSYEEARDRASRSPPKAVAAATTSAG
jgi:hypothetical protein